MARKSGMSSRTRSGRGFPDLLRPFNRDANTYGIRAVESSRTRQRDSPGTSPKPIARGEPPVSVPGPLLGGARPVATEHLPVAPAAELQKVTFLHPGAQHLVGERMPE